MFYIPILGSIANAAGTTLQKAIMKNRNMGVRKYQTIEFLSIILFMLLFIPFFWKIDSEAFKLKAFFIFLGVVLISFFGNLFMNYSMKKEKINNIEPIKILEPLFVVLLSLLFSLFFHGLYESKIKFIVPSLIACFALIFSHFEKHHLKFNRYILSAITGSFLFALELVLSKLILDYYSPFTFYFLRCLGIFLLTFFIFMPKLDGLNKKEKIHFSIIGPIWVILRVVIYYGYSTTGVILTNLLLMLGPVLVYAFARIFLKEKLNWKNILSSIIIILCIIYVNIF